MKYCDNKTPSIVRFFWLEVHRIAMRGRGIVDHQLEQGTISWSRKPDLREDCSAICAEAAQVRCL